MLTGTNTKVGLAEGIQGVCQVLAAFPAGLLADKSRRDKVLRLAAVVGQLAVVAILLALFSCEILGNDIGGQEPVKFVLICVGLGRLNQLSTDVLAFHVGCRIMGNIYGFISCTFGSIVC